MVSWLQALRQDDAVGEGESATVCPRQRQPGGGGLVNRTCSGLQPRWRSGGASAGVLYFTATSLHGAVIDQWKRRIC
jgi:hypothetical protein